MARADRETRRKIRQTKRKIRKTKRRVKIARKVVGRKLAKIEKRMNTQGPAALNACLAGISVQEFCPETGTAPLPKCSLVESKKEGPIGRIHLKVS